MPDYQLSLWSADLGRFIQCRLGGEGAASLLDEFNEAGRCALKLAACASHLPSHMARMPADRAFPGHGAAAP